MKKNMTDRVHGRSSIMAMLPQEEIDREIGWVLREIKKELLYQTPAKRKPIKFTIRDTRNDPAIPAIQSQKKVLLSLKTKKILDFQIVGRFNEHLKLEIHQEEMEAFGVGKTDDVFVHNDVPYTFLLTIHMPKFEKICGTYEKKIRGYAKNMSLITKSIDASSQKKQHGEKEGGLAEIYYNKVTGIGFAKGKRFQYRTENPKSGRFVFEKLYENMGKVVPRKEVLKLGGFKKSGKDILENFDARRKPSHATEESYYISYLIGEIRKKTRLTKDEIVLVKDGLILVGKKLKSHPEITPNLPESP